MRFAILLVALLSTPTRADEWSPPINPNPQSILQEARADTRAERYEAALAKHVWFHENALAIRPSLYGVRLSFALSDWLDLAQEYPPALTKLKEIRDNARENLMAGREVMQSFRDMEAINAHLDEQMATRKVFETLDEKRPKIAEKVFDLAQPSLIHGKAYSLIGKYISPKDDFAKMRQTYRLGKRLAGDARFGATHLEFANKKFANDSTTLVAILAVNDRRKDAEEIAASARAEWNDIAFHDALEKALKGVVPDPWP
jgi:hypothetical protein